MWANVEYYTEEYLFGRSPTIPEADFPYWEKQARSRINRNNVEIEDVPICLKECVCEVAEALCQDDTAPKPGDIKSESNAGYSYTLQDRGMSQADFESQIQAIIVKHLSGTALHNSFVFKGV